jgi:hypothetical protein
VKVWRVNMNNASTGADTATAYAVCAKKPTGYGRELGATVDIPAQSQGSAAVSCYNGTRVLGGGAHSYSRGLDVNLSSTAATTNTTWTSRLNNSGLGVTELEPWVVCATVS